MSGRWPLINMRTIHLYFPNPEHWALVRPEGSVPAFITLLLRRLHLRKRLKFRKLIGLVQQHANQSLGRRRSITESNFRFIPLFYVSSPLEPFRLCFFQFECGQGNRIGYIPASSSRASLSVHGSKLHHQWVPISEIAQNFSIGMSTVYRRSFYPNGIPSTMGNTPLSI